MPTKNPKVSAYIPQHIFDRFQSFCQEKEMSMSQATAVVFAGYFEIEPEVNHLSGLLADRIRDLELKLSELSGSRNSSNGELPKEAVSKLKSELLDILLKEFKSSIDEMQKVMFDELATHLQKELQSRLLLSSSSEPHLESVDHLGNKQLNLGVEPKIVENLSRKATVKKKSVTKKTNPKPLASTLDVLGRDVDGLTNGQLIERFGGGASSLISKQKSRHKNAPDKFTNWTKSRDPHKYGWEYRENVKLYYRIKPLA